MISNVHRMFQDPAVFDDGFATFCWCQTSNSRVAVELLPIPAPRKSSECNRCPWS